MPAASSPIVASAVGGADDDVPPKSSQAATDSRVATTKDHVPLAEPFHNPPHSARPHHPLTRERRSGNVPSGYGEEGGRQTLDSHRTCRAHRLRVRRCRRCRPRDRVRSPSRCVRRGRSGRPQSMFRRAREFPLPIGYEGVGRCSRRSARRGHQDRLRRWCGGRRGAGLPRQHYLTALTVPPEGVRQAPALGFAEAANLLLAGATAADLLRVARVTNGDTILLRARRRGSGVAVLQLARRVRCDGHRDRRAHRPRTRRTLRRRRGPPYGGLLGRIEDAAPGSISVALDAAGTDEAIDASLSLVFDRSRIVTISPRNTGPRPTGWSRRRQSARVLAFRDAEIRRTRPACRTRRTGSACRTDLSHQRRRPTRWRWSLRAGPAARSRCSPECRGSELWVSGRCARRRASRRRSVP